MRDPYSVLGVTRLADTETIRKAYKKLARKWHPDINKEPGAETRFKEVNAAYDVVGDDEKRKLWDEFGEASTRPGFDAQQARQWGRAGPGMGGFDFGGGGVDVEDLLGSIFGAGGAGQRRARRGPDQQLRLSVDLLTTITGGEQQVSVRRPDGRLEMLTVPIPAGASDGGKVRLKGQGLPPRGGGPCGDLIVQLQVAPHPLLRRDGDDLFMDVPLTVMEALQGARITVPTPTGDIKLTVQPGVHTQRKVRIKGRGVQRRGKPGDLYLLLRPVLPDSDEDHVRLAAEAFQAAYTGDVRRDLKL